MLCCYVCRTPVDSGFIQGFPPAPDSQKLALCKKHDTPKNRAVVAEAWTNLLTESLQRDFQVLKHKAGGNSLGVTVSFAGGGSLDFICTSCVPTTRGTLRLEQENGDCTYIPLRLIKSYLVRMRP